MKKLLLFILLFFLTNNVYAEWIYFGNNINDDMFFYKKSAIKRNKEKVKVWMYINKNLTDKSDSIDLKYPSHRYLIELDCIQDTSRDLRNDVFTERDLKGEMMVLSESIGQIKHIPPDSVIEKLSQLMCKK